MNQRDRIDQLEHDMRVERARFDEARTCWERERAETAVELKRLRAINAYAEDIIRHTNDHADDIIRAARSHAGDIIRDARKHADNLIKTENEPNAGNRETARRDQKGHTVDEFGLPLARARTQADESMW